MARSITINKKGYFIIKASVLSEDIAILEFYIPNKIASKYIKGNI